MGEVVATVRNRQPTPLKVIVLLGLLTACQGNATSTSHAGGLDARVDAPIEAATTDAIPEAGGLPADASDEDAGIEEGADKAMDLLGQLATLVEANKANCNLLAQRLDAFYDVNGPFIEHARRTYYALKEPEQLELRKKHQAQFMKNWRRFQPTMKVCKDNPNLKAVLNRALP